MLARGTFFDQSQAPMPTKRGTVNFCYSHGTCKKTTEIAHCWASFGTIRSLKIWCTKVSHIPAFFGILSWGAWAQKHRGIQALANQRLKLPLHFTETQRNRGAHRTKAQASVALSLRYIYIYIYAHIYIYTYIYIYICIQMYTVAFEVLRIHGC